MDTFVQKLPIIGFPYFFALIVSAIIRLFFNSRPLNLAVLEWLTEYEPKKNINDQYVTISSYFYGNSSFSAKRHFVFICIFLSIFLFLCVINFFAYSAFDNQEEFNRRGFWTLALQMYAVWYFHIWDAIPYVSFILLLFGYCICHGSYVRFYYSTLKWKLFGEGFVAYLTRMIISLVIIMFMLILLSALSAHAILSKTNSGLFEFLAEFFVNFQSQLTLLYNLTQTETYESSGDDDWSPVFF